jgi:hypothetical protein
MVGKLSFATTYVDNGTNTNYALNSGDSLYIASGTYTGDITKFASGAKITVSIDAIFQPVSIPSNSGGTMNVYGTATMNFALITNTNFTLNNYGFFTANLTTEMKGSGQLWTNNFGAVMNLIGDVTVNSNPSESNTVINYGTINCGAGLTMTTNATIINYKKLNVGGEFKVNGGTLENRGKLETTGLLNFNNGAAIIRNYCGMSSLGGIRNTSVNFYNYSYLWARNDNGQGDIANSGTIYMVNWNFDNPTQAMIHGKNYTQSGAGTLTGKGWLYFYGTTSQTGGVTGTAGVTTDTLKMYDISRINTSVFYDPPPPGGTVYPNAIYNAWGVPDSTRAYFVGCSVEIIMEVPLAISWNYFFVTLDNNIPELTWSAEFDRSTTFEIQRSYDGTNFSAIKVLPSELGRSDYKFDDELINSQAPVAYYRIKATQLSGEEKYTQIRMVRFSNKPGAIYMAPNPFTNNFIISYQAAEKEMLTIRIFNVSGQQKLVKNVSVNNGINNINITEAAQFAKGIYVIQVCSRNNIISSSKIIKQ